MRRLFVSVLVIIGVFAGVNAAPREVVRSAGVSQSGAGRNNTAARVATNKTVAARSATNTTSKTISARAATPTQKVINSGTKIAAATQNTAVNEECQNKYFGCMDAFCMLDNTSGGRCLCSNRNAELDTVLNEIEKLDQQTYEMATLGVEQIEMGADADVAIAKANAMVDATVARNSNSKKKSRAALVDLSLWNTEMEEDAFLFDGDVFQSSIDGKTGDALQSAAADLCTAQIPECSRDMSMLQLLYAQRIKSDCTAYENSLKQRKNSSQTKLSAAQKALRDAALEQIQASNKYDLGQCTIQFKKCMQTTGGCGDDFAACASVAAFDNTNANKSTSKKAKNHSIKGEVTTIEISASTYDTLVAKRPMCESVTKSCTLVADKVWETFLREIAPTIKSAEIIAEDETRQNCIGNIAKCFRNACKDNIDPNDPDGSYDMCLTRPGTMLAMCKIPLNACGVDATTEESAKKSQIWDYVLARLAFMRIDSCTKAVKSCLQSADRCGNDYSQCVGLDTQTILDMCPSEKLVACQEDGQKKPLSEMYDLITGILLNIDNNMLQQCQNNVTTKMLEICGDTETCAAFDNDDSMGTDSLMSYKDSDGDFIIDGLVNFGVVKIVDADDNKADNDVKLDKYVMDISDYSNRLVGGTSNATNQRIVASLQSTGNKIKRIVDELTEDPQIKMCVGGRDMSQIRNRGESDRTEARFPNLIDSTIMTIINAGLDKASQNYDKKYKELLGKAMDGQDTEYKTALCASMAGNTGDICQRRSVSGRCRGYENVFDKIFADTKVDENSGDGYLTRHVISGAKLSDVFDAQRVGQYEYSLVDNNNNEVEHVTVRSVYSASTNICTITTESRKCRGVDSGTIIKSLGIQDIAKKCMEYDAPITTTSIIEM